MDFQLVAPPPDLSPWVTAGVRVSLRSPSAQPLPVHLPALVEGGLTVVLEGDLGLPGADGGFTALPRCLMSGPNPLPATLYRTPRLRCVGLRLQPAGLAALLGASPGALPAAPASAGDIWGLAWTQGLERLHDAADDDARLRVLFDFVRGWLGRHSRNGERTLKAWRLQGAALDLPGAGAAMGLTHRQFERRFDATFGLRPKLFQRIARLEGVLRAAIPSGRTDTQLALEHGYYDQSHLGRELRLLAGTSLTALVDAVRAGDERYWPLAIGARVPAPRAPDRSMSFFS